jgi:Tat-targeted selenate reductase subunit YnfE
VLQNGVTIDSVFQAGLYICQGWGPQRQANGELTSRAIAMLPILTGKGINGGNSGARESTYTITIERMPLPDNPVKTQISCFSWTDAIVRGPEMTALRDGVRGKDKLDVPIKFIWNYAGNTIINQHSDINKTHDILQDESKCETIVVIDNFMTSSAKYADILLPDLMTVEQEDIIPNDYAGNMGYLIFLQPVTAPKFERKPIYWIMSEVAKRLGSDIHQQFTEGRTQAQWLQFLYAKMLAKDPQLPSYDALKQMGIYKRKDPAGHFVAYKNSATTPRQTHSKPHRARLKSTPARWPGSPAPGRWKKMKPSARCRSMPLRLTAGMPLSAAPSRFSCSASTLKPAPTPATATLMFCKRPAARRSGSTLSMPTNVALRTATWCASLTIAVSCVFRRK